MLYTKAPGKDLYLLLSTCVCVDGWLHWCWYCYTCKIERKKTTLFVIIKAIFSGSTLIFLKGVRFGSAAGHTWGEKQRLKCCLQQQSKSLRCKWALLCRGLVRSPVDNLQCCTTTVRLHLLPTRPLPCVRWERLHGGNIRTQEVLWHFMDLKLREKDSKHVAVCLHEGEGPSKKQWE